MTNGDTRGLDYSASGAATVKEGCEGRPKLRNLRLGNFMGFLIIPTYYHPLGSPLIKLNRA